jgi:DNA-binding transcriptional regulator YhcF (GntR family)
MEFHRDSRSGLAPYLQIVEQVKEASRLGLITPGDQLPTVREVVTQLAVNPNTVLKAYRMLEYEGLVEGRAGQGTFVVGTLGGLPPETYSRMSRKLLPWLREARAAGMDDESILALVNNTLRDQARARVA